MSSSMLEQAVIDAETLKEAAVKNAEQEVLEKYSGEIKEAVNTLLEQDEADLGMDPLAMDPMAMPPMGAIPDPLAAPEEAKALDAVVEDIPLKALDDLGINDLSEGDEINLDLDALIKSVRFGDDEEDPQPSKEGLMFETTEADLHDLLEYDLKGDIGEYAGSAIGAALGGAAPIPGGALVGGYLGGKAGEVFFDDDEEEEPDEESTAIAQGALIDAFGNIEGGEVSLEAPGTRYEESLDEEELYEEELYEDEELDEDAIAQAIEEMLKVDLENVPRGMLGTTHPTKLEQIRSVEVAAARDEDTEVQEENDEFDKALKKIVNLEEQVKSLKSGKNRLAKEHKELKSVAREISNKLTELNTANAKLVYQNRILESHSLNERQKEKLVEAVSNATSTKEAKVIFDTLQDSLSNKGNNSPKNLNEAISKNSRLVLKSNKKETQVSNSATERMKKLAGII